ncbi:MarR family transcriptional regulator [Gordonia sp. PDNC005]|uniref:MarR family transcriptional regulator n=1 Tax=unclassified Gordonia (in: high G+C Gram-positive bacteria) TaxID=2657482 RepID=UPI001964F0EA|nr:MarR family transcriptional regulator [Gordonia sp. PDNC005]QRY63036.1 MarR family transcriptional regulator [Gordonia sp. PDNC005]
MSDAAGPAVAATGLESSTDLVKNLLLGAHATAASLAAIGTNRELTVDEWLILDALGNADGLSMSTLSRRTLASGASLTRAVDKLVTASLVYRAPSATDRRKVEVRISELGRERHAEMSDEVRALDSTLRSLMGADADIVADVLGRIGVNLG